MAAANGYPYDAILFDLLTALLDSRTLWNDVAGSDEDGVRWRRRYIELTYSAGAYRDYEEIVAESASSSGLAPSLAAELVARWDELAPWPEGPAVLEELASSHRLAVVTNCSEELGQRAADRLGVPVEVLVTAERAGFYKPRPEPYRRALSELGLNPERALFIAGSPNDVPGAGAVGLPVVWHDRTSMPAPSGAGPLARIDTLEALPAIARSMPPLATGR